MDLFAIRAVNAIVGNSLDAAALEWALGGGAVRFDRDCLFAIGGATARAIIAGRVIVSGTATPATPGEERTVDQVTGRGCRKLHCDGGTAVAAGAGSRAPSGRWGR